MEQALPMEELANQRLNVLVYAYSLFIKNLMEEGLDREKVKNASDKAWGALGVQAGEQLKSLFEGSEKITAIQQAGAIAQSVHGIETDVESTENEVKTVYSKCPWQDALQALGLPKEWRFCNSGHAAFTETMLKSLHPDISYELTRNMPTGDDVCEDISKL